MKLLLVDDQAYVLQGLCQGIPWAEHGFDEVFTALNALEARQILSAHRIDIMLCDIEMPFENGLSLIRWLREQNMPTRCILLTAHPDFAYAKEAIPLDVTEYVVQPAPYSEILEAVQKAIREVDLRAQREELHRLGESMDQSKELLSAMSLAGWLVHQQRAPYERILKMSSGQLPAFEKRVCLALLCVVRWESHAGWSSEALTYALNNILAELFAACDQHIVLTELEKDTYACVIWDGDSAIFPEIAVSQFEYLRSVFRLYFHAEIAVYLESDRAVEQLPQLLGQLRSLHNANVARYGMVQTLTMAIQAQEQTNQESIGQQENLAAVFQALLERGKAAELQNKLEEELNSRLRSGTLDLSALNACYQNLLQAIYGAAEQTGLDPRGFLEGTEGRALYHNALRSVEDMLAFSRFVCSQYGSSDDDPEAKRITRQAIAYIGRNLDKPLRREEIAAYVHVSEGYLSRVFRREKGVSLKEYIIEERLLMAQSMLCNTTLPISLIAVRVGYSNFSQFSQSYRTRFGRSPSAERKNANWDREQEGSSTDET